MSGLQDALLTLWWCRCEVMSYHAYMAGRSYPLSLFISALCILISSASLIYLRHGLGSLVSTVTFSSVTWCLFYTIGVFSHCCCWFPLARSFPHPSTESPSRFRDASFITARAGDLVYNTEFCWLLALSLGCTRMILGVKGLVERPYSMLLEYLVWISLMYGRPILVVLVLSL